MPKGRTTRLFVLLAGIVIGALSSTIFSLRSEAQTTAFQMGVVGTVRPAVTVYDPAQKKLYFYEMVDRATPALACTFAATAPDRPGELLQTGPCR